MKRWRAAVLGITAWDVTVEVDAHNATAAAKRALSAAKRLLADDPPNGAAWQTNVSHEVDVVGRVLEIDEV